MFDIPKEDFKIFKLKLFLIARSVTHLEISIHNTGVPSICLLLAVIKREYNFSTDLNYCSHVFRFPFRCLNNQPKDYFKADQVCQMHGVVIQPLSEANPNERLF